MYSPLLFTTSCTFFQLRIHFDDLKINRKNSLLTNVTNLQRLKNILKLTNGCFFTQKTIVTLL